MPFSTGFAHIETVTKGVNQRDRRTVAYLVVDANRKVVARFNVNGAPGNTLEAARQALRDFEARETP